ncbi:hypothetical protein N665_0724s0002 [Sinapis alba]|nr:hypothetical protein N665_0724s0002 [Sinapis alba]
MGDEEQSEYDWEQEDQPLTDEEGCYEDDQWTDSCSNTDYDDDPEGGELEPEPPDHYQDNTSSIDWSREEADQGVNHEGELCQEETESQIILDEHNHYEEETQGVQTEDCFNEEAEAEQEVVYPEDGFDDNSEHEESYVEERPWCEVPYFDHEEENYDDTDSQVSSYSSEVNIEDGAESDHNFAEEEIGLCHHQGPESYLTWERDMEQWFQLHQVKEEEKTIIAEDTLTEYAFWWYDIDCYHRLEFDIPEASCTEMKEHLHKEFVAGAESTWTKEYYYRRLDISPKPRRLILAPMPTPKTKPKKICGLKQREVTCNTSRSKSNDKKIVPSKKKPKVQHVQTEAVPKKGTQQKHNKYPKQKVEQCKSSDLSKLASIICYRCHQKGHYAVACPSRSVETLPLATPEINAFKNNLAQLIPEMSISSVIHLSLPRYVDAGNKETLRSNA